MTVHVCIFIMLLYIFHHLPTGQIKKKLCQSLKTEKKNDWNVSKFIFKLTATFNLHSSQNEK
jgi:hypothetical protein